VDTKPKYFMTINGVSAVGGASFAVKNPASGDVFAYSPSATAEDLDAAVSAAKAAFPGWRSMPIEQRKERLLKAGEVITSHADELTHLFVLEQGRPLQGAKQEILGAAQWFQATAQLDVPVQITEDNDARRVEVHHEPLGVVCAIVPWNFPVILATWKMAPALLAGNTLVVKPSPFTPLCTLRIGELLREVFPPGVLNVIAGGDELGPMMTAHPGFAKISFTGSTATGKRVMASAASDLKRITLELGGNDAAIVLADVDVDSIASQLFFGAFFNTAQICTATKRMYIHDNVYEQLRDKLHELASSMSMGDGMTEGVVFGPIQNALQFDRVRNLLADARANNYTLLEGKLPPEGGGYFIPITLVDNPPDSSRVVVEEAFGPVLPLMRFSEIDEVIRRANDTEYGLAGAVWSKDVAKALAVAKRLETGTVWINQNLQATPLTPMAGHKKSGFGAENGIAGLLEFTQPKVFYIPKAS
jgi:acyl-CoA reductase-like NAD-dependent aldehyde dehydrogenase